MKITAIALLSTVVAIPAFAQTGAVGAGDRSPAAAYAAAKPPGPPAMAAARATAIRECSARAKAYTEYTWGNLEFEQYRGCMAERGQVE